MEAGGQAGTKKIKVSDWFTEKRIGAQEEHIWELQEILDGKKGSLRKTDRSQREANDNLWSLNLETGKALETLGSLCERFEQSN